MTLLIWLAAQELSLERARTEDRLAVTLAGRERLADGTVVKLTLQPIQELRADLPALLALDVDAPAARSIRARVEQGRWTAVLKYRAADLPPGRIRVTVEADGLERREEVLLSIGAGERYLVEEVNRLRAALDALAAATAGALKLEDKALTAARGEKVVAEISRALETLMAGATASPLRRTIGRLNAMLKKLHVDLVNGTPLRALLEQVQSEVGRCREAFGVELALYVRTCLADVRDETERTWGDDRAWKPQARAFCRALRDGHAQGLRLSESYAPPAEDVPDLLDRMERMLETHDEALREELKKLLP